MKLNARLETYSSHGPDPWDSALGIQLPLDHIICRDIDGTPHAIGEFSWPWRAYTKDHKKRELHFYYWNQNRGTTRLANLEVSPEREARIRELQFLMTRLLYYGNENAPRTLDSKLRTLHSLARFAEARSCKIYDVLTDTPLLDAFGARLAEAHTSLWMGWLTFLRQLDPETQLGFTPATPKHWTDLKRREKDYRSNGRQHAPLPSKIYATLINNLSAELDDIETHTPALLAALREGLAEHARAKEVQKGHDFSVGPALIKKHGLGNYFIRRGFHLRNRKLATLSGTVTEIFLVCKLQIQVFSGMRHGEAQTLPYHCMITKKGHHGRTHSLIAGITTKFNKGRRLQTHWVTTDREGFRAIRLAQQFASIIYESVGITPSKTDTEKDEFPLFVTSDYLPWGSTKKVAKVRMQTACMAASAKKSLLSRLLPIIKEEDIAELEEIDPFRAWRDEPEFAIGQRWPLATHQLRRSLAVYANASGLVRLSSLRRQLQHITREMSLYYGRGSTFCKNFIADNPKGYKMHIASEWQDGEDEAMALAFTRDVLNSKEPMFGGAGNFYQRQKERGEVMSREDVAARIKAGLMVYQPGPLGGCIKPGGCDKRRGLALVDISCATDGCKNLVGKHSKIIRVIQLKRAALAHVMQNSIEAGIEREELEALERVEREWRPKANPSANLGGPHA